MKKYSKKALAEKWVAEMQSLGYTPDQIVMTIKYAYETNISLKLKAKVPIVARFYNLEETDLYLFTTNRKIIAARQVVFWLEVNENMTQLGRPKLSAIARQFVLSNGKTLNHASIQRSVKVVNDFVRFDRQFRRSIYKLQLQIFGKVVYILDKNLAYDLNKQKR